MSGKEIDKKHHQTFESIRQENDEGSEFWYAKDLHPVFDYSSWDKFKQVINKAVTVFKKSGQAAEDHFPRTVKMVPIGSGTQRKEKLRRENIKGKIRANMIHYEVGVKVR